MSVNNTVTLFLMTQKGFETLNALVDGYSDAISAVVTARDLSLQKDYYEEIKSLCIKHAIPFCDRTEHEVIKSKYAIAVSWRWLINASSKQLIVFHDSLLPKYRGFNPLVSALINGEERIGVTALFGSDQYDEGDIISSSAANVNYPIKIQEAIDLIVDSYKELAINIVQTIVRGDTIRATKQNETDASYSLWRDDDDYRVNWQQSSKSIKRFIDSVGFPYAGALTAVNTKLARILDAEIVQDVSVENRAPGKVIFMKEGIPVVVCGTGLLKINELLEDASGASLLPLRKFRSRFT